MRCSVVFPFILIALSPALIGAAPRQSFHAKTSITVAQQSDDQSSTCTIAGTSVPWNPPGTMVVTIDGTSVGSFDFGPNGSDSLDFSCTPGRHTFSFAIANTAIRCAGVLNIGSGLTFLPAMRVDQLGNSICSLTPQTSQ